jgi:hypothetical protein
VFQENLLLRGTAAGSSDAVVLTHQSAWHHILRKTDIWIRMSCSHYLYCITGNSNSLLNKQLLIKFTFLISWFGLWHHVLWYHQLLLKMKTLCLSQVVLHCSVISHNNNTNGYHHKISNLVSLLSVPVSHSWSPVFAEDRRCRGEWMLHICSSLVYNWMTEPCRILATVLWS